MLDSVAEFHNAFGIKNALELNPNLTMEETLLRYKLIREENEEYLDAAAQKNIVEIADALGDILYIACGTILKHGLQDKMEEVFCEIHKSNMSKLGKDGKPIYREDGKVMKGPDYFKPNIERIVLD